MLNIFNTCTDPFYSIFHYAKNISEGLQKDGIPNKLYNEELVQFMGVPIENFRGSTILFENNGKVMLFYYGDGNTPITPSEIDDFHNIKKLPNCLGSVSITRNKSENLFNADLPYFEHKYMAVDSHYSNHYEETFDQLKDKVIFGGQTFLNRSKFLLKLVDDKLPVTILKSRLDIDDYFAVLKEFKLVASPPGGCDISKRDIECFGLGIPIIRPKYSTIESLKPEVHYISSEYVANVKNKVFEDKDLLFSVVRNARKYYEDYILKQDYLVDIVKRFLKETE